MPSSSAIEAHKDAVKLQRWSLESTSRPINYRILTTFLRGLFDSFSSCLVQKSTVPRTNGERMWESFHQLRTHSDFMKRWQQFLTASIDSKSTPILYQNISDRLFRILLKQKLCVTTKPADTAYTSTLTYEEQNAFRYAARYIHWIGLVTSTKSN